MTWVNAALASIGFFLISIFGGSQLPSTQAPTQPTSTHYSGTANVPRGGSIAASSTESRIISANNTSALAPYSLSQMSPTDEDYVLHSYTVSNGHVYYDGALLAGSDPNTFRIIPVKFVSDDGSSHIQDSWYVKDSTHVWFIIPQSNSTLIPGADPSTFTPLDFRAKATGEYAKDKNHAYYDARILTSADPNTFVVAVTSGGDAHDASHSYLDGDLTENDFYVEGNNLYVHRILTVKNIPATLGLVPSTLGQAPIASIQGVPIEADGFGSWDGYWPFDDGVSGTTDLYEGVATSTDGSLVAFVYARQSAPEVDQSGGYGWPTDTFGSILTYSASGLQDRYDLDINKFDPDLIQILSVTSSQIMFDLGDGKCSNELYKLSIPTNQLTDLGVDHANSSSDCAY